MDQLFEELDKKLFIIRTKNWTKCEFNGTGCTGMQLEKLLGKNLDNYLLPDLNGIEIKTKCLSKNIEKYGLSLFSSAFDDYPNSNQDFFNKVCIYDSNCNQYKFQRRINTLKGIVVRNFYIKIITDDKLKKIKLIIINRKNHNVESIHSWNYSELEARLTKKLKYMVLVYAKLYTINNIKYVKYLDYHFYKLKPFQSFLYCINKGYITINFNIIKKKTIIDKGTSFEININKIEELFDEIKKDN